MTARRIARELAVIVMPQLPKDGQKLSAVEFDGLVAKAIHMLCDYAKQNLADANAALLRSSQSLTEIEIEHPAGGTAGDRLESVPMTTGQLREQIALVERAIEFVAEALDIPEVAMQNPRNKVEIKCRQCDNMQDVYIERPAKSEVRDFLLQVVTTYLDHKSDIDQFIKNAKAKWHIDRMVSIDRDILRLACAEAFFMPDVPVNVCISEAVELCHRFADEKAAKFINGILGDLSDHAKYYRRNGKFMEAAMESGSTPGQESFVSEER